MFKDNFKHFKNLALNQLFLFPNNNLHQNTKIDYRA